SVASVGTADPPPRLPLRAGASSGPVPRRRSRISSRAKEDRMHALRAPGRRALGLVSLSLLSVLALPLRADGQAGPDGIVILGLEPAPPHPHDPSPVPTWPPDLQNPFHQHQHRTNHDPRRASIAFGGVSPYIADKVWVGRRSVRMGGDHPVP